MNTNITYMQGADFDILATDIKSTELIGHNITGSASPSLIVSFPDNNEKENKNCELLVTNDKGEIIPIKINNKYNEPLNIINNNISLNYNSSYLNTTNGKLTLSNDVINKINKLENDIISITYTTDSVNNELAETQNTISEMSNDMDVKYSSLNNAVLSKQIKYAINIDESIMPTISTEDIFKEKTKIYDIAGNIYFDNNEKEINIGENSTLKFSGGTISNGKLIGSNTEIIGSKYKLFNNCKLEGTFTNNFLPEWFGAKADGKTDDSNAINTLLSMNITNDILFTNNYLCKNILNSIKNNIYISGEIDLCNLKIDIENVKLIFTGNGKIKNGAIKFNHTEIIADSNQIFENISFTENSIIANDAIKVEWFGAKADGKTDDSKAINTTIDQVSKLKTDNINIQPIILLSHNIYYIKDTIHIYENNSRFTSLGTIITTDDIVAVEVCGNNIDININAIKNRKLFDDIDNIPGLHSWDNPKLFIGTAFRIQQTVFNSKININVIDRYKNGIVIAPRLFKDYFCKETQSGNKYHPDKLFAGIQYCEFNFKMIHAQKCIEINVVPNMDSKKEQEKYIEYDKFWIWVNENNFNGGRFFCVQNTSEFDPATALGKDSGYGLYMVEGTDEENPIGLVCGGIDGNMFNHIGFEGLWQAIKLWKCKFHIFNDIRMCESLYAGTIPNDKECPWIELNNCEKCEFNIKGLIPMDKIKLVKCKSINFNGQFTEPDNPEGTDWFGITGNRFTNLYGDNAIKTYNIDGTSTISDDPLQNGFYGILPQTGIKSENLITLIYRDKNTDNTETIYNFNDLFAKTGTKLKNGKSFTLSNLCRISLWDEECITIDFKDSIWGLHPDMTLKVSLGSNSKIYLVHGDTKLYIDGNETANAIEKSGLYKITYRLNCNNVQDEIYILPLYYDK